MVVVNVAFYKAVVYWLLWVFNVSRLMLLSDRERVLFIIIIDCFTFVNKKYLVNVNIIGRLNGSGDSNASVQRTVVSFSYTYYSMLVRYFCLSFYFTSQTQKLRKIYAEKLVAHLSPHHASLVSIHLENSGFIGSWW